MSEQRTTKKDPHIDRRLVRVRHVNMTKWHSINGVRHNLNVMVSQLRSIKGHTLLVKVCKEA